MDEPESSPKPTSGNSKHSVEALKAQFKANLNRTSIEDIIKGGPHRWSRVVSQMYYKLRQKQASEVVTIERGIKADIKNAHLKPISFEFGYQDLSGVSVGCELPQNQTYQLMMPPGVGEKLIPELPTALPPGKYLELPATTSQDLRGTYFNNGFFFIDSFGQLRQVTEKVESFKGAITIAFQPRQVSGGLNIMSPADTQQILASEKPGEVFPSGGLILGASLYAELGPNQNPTIEDAIKAMVSNRYFETYNNQIPCYIQIGTRNYYFNNMLKDTYSNEASQAIAQLVDSLDYLSDDDKQSVKGRYELKPLALIIGTLAALQAASKLKSPNETAKIALVEQNYSGRLFYKDKKNDRNYAIYPMMVMKL